MFILEVDFYVKFLVNVLCYGVHRTEIVVNNIKLRSMLIWLSLHIVYDVLLLSVVFSRFRENLKNLKTWYKRIQLFNCQVQFQI